MVTYVVKVLKDIRALFELPIRTANVFSSNFIEYRSNGALSV